MNDLWKKSIFDKFNIHQFSQTKIKLPEIKINQDMFKIYTSDTNHTRDTSDTNQKNNCNCIDFLNNFLFYIESNVDEEIVE